MNEWWAVVVVGFTDAPKKPMFVNVASIHQDKDRAKNVSNALRAEWRRKTTDERSSVEQLSVHVRPFLTDVVYPKQGDE